MRRCYKHSFTTYTEAERASRHGHPNNAYNHLTPYRCQWCRQWHIGHTPQTRYRVRKQRLEQPKPLRYDWW
jgi:hypothetical protein